LGTKLQGLAAKAAGAVGCEMAGVDILEGSDGPLVIEVNSQPGWKGLQSVADIDIAEEIVDVVLGRLKA